MTLRHGDCHASCSLLLFLVKSLINSIYVKVKVERSISALVDMAGIYLVGSVICKGSLS